MSATIIDGMAFAESIRAGIARDVKLLRAKGREVRLACVQVGDKPESKLYVKNQQRVSAAVGIDFVLVQLPETISEAELVSRIQELSRAPEITGIILELPLPPGMDSFACQQAIAPAKDAEGVHPCNLGLLVYGVTRQAPCTAIAAYQLIKSTGVELRGKECTVVGHSRIVGKPVSMMLLNELCTVTTCHIATRDLAVHTCRADILVVAAGRPGLITADMVKPGAVVIDVGVNRVPVLDAECRPVLNEKGKPTFQTVGDVDFEAVKERAGWLTPVPGGVGPLTVTMLLRNVANAARSAGTSAANEE